MLINEVLSLLLKKKIPFSSNDFVQDFHTRGFSRFNLKLCGLWLLLYTGVKTDRSHILSNLSPSIAQLSIDGNIMLYAWPFDDNCNVEHFTNADEK